MKNFICIVIALILLAVSAVILYPGLVKTVNVEEQYNAFIDGVTENGAEYYNSQISIENFPFYNDVKQALETAEGYLKGETDEIPDMLNAFGEIAAHEGFTNTLFSFLLLALMTIPVYMLLRLIPYTTIYRAAGSAFLLSRPITRGVAACACSVTSVSFTWFLYHTIIYKRLYAMVVEWFASLSRPEIALTVTNIVIIIVIAVAVIGILKTTLFRGSFIKSVLLAVLRALLFVLVFAVIETYAALATTRVILFVLAAIAVVGIVDLLVDPVSKAK